MDITPALVRLTGTIDDIRVVPFAPDEPFDEFAARFSRLEGAVALLSGGSLGCARFHLLAALPWLTVKGHGSKYTLSAKGKTIHYKGDPFELIRQLMHLYAIEWDHPGIPVGAGLFGYLGYDLKDHIETLPRTSVDDLLLPHLCLYAPSVIVVYDKQNRRGWMSENRRMPSGKTGQKSPLQRFSDMLALPVPPAGDFRGAPPALSSSLSRDRYLEAIKIIKDYIAAGDIYQVNLSQRFTAGFEGDPYTMFQALYRSAPAPFYAYVHAGDHFIVSTSPERFLCRRGNRVETRPIKGTRPRGKTESEDLANARALLESRKDEAELSMIVDLMRNDLGRVCRGGSVRVTEHRRLEAYENVYHLVSVITGELAPDMDSADLLRATFPGGSITGCPRIRAMEIIDELEPCRRHVYTGSIGYLGFHDTLDLSIAIRTATIHQGRIFFSVGGGVVFDSDPEDEFEETLHKGRSLAGVLRAEEIQSPPEAIIWKNGILVPGAEAAVPVADLGLQYGYGFFETIRIRNGEPCYLDDHLDRFDSAWTALMDGPAPDLTWREIIRQVIQKNGLQNRTAAVKILATCGPAGNPHRPGLLVSARLYQLRPAIRQKGGLHLAVYPHPRQTPLADHKTLNYLYYFQAGKWAEAQGADEALILNPDGSISETHSAGILLVKDKTVIRPRSPHVLPGIMQKQAASFLIRNGYTECCRSIRVKHLPAMDAMLAANSLMGAVPVLSVGQTPLPAISSELRELLAEFNDE